MTESETPNPDGISGISGLPLRGDLKVWSLLVTLFGDAAMAPGATLSGPQLTEILGALQIRPEAQRVALHRLRKEGWITATRQGRIGIYGLSEIGRHETQGVAEQVYADSVAAAQTPYLVICPNGGVAPEPALSLGEGRYLSTAPGGADDISAPLVGSLPGWVAAAAVPAPLMVELASLHAALKEAPPLPDDPTQAAARRLLILHHWRRLALRMPPPAEALLGPHWIGAACRARVARHLRDLQRLTPTPAPPSG